MPDPAMFDGTRDKLERFVAQIRAKLYSDAARFPTSALRMAYTFNRLEGYVQSQILPFTQNDTTLADANDIVRILEAAFGDPDPAATARERLHARKQGKKDFASYYAEFQMLVAKLHWNEHAKMDALREGLCIELHEKLVGTHAPTTFAQFAATCQQLDSQIRAFQARQRRLSAPAHRTQPALPVQTPVPDLVPRPTIAPSPNQDPRPYPPTAERFLTKKGLRDSAKDAAYTAEVWAIWQGNVPTKAGIPSARLLPSPPPRWRKPPSVPMWLWR